MVLLDTKKTDDRQYMYMNYIWGIEQEYINLHDISTNKQNTGMGNGESSNNAFVMHLNVI